MVQNQDLNQDPLQRAVQHHQAGRLAQAEAIYRQLLAQQPRHADALDHLGVIAAQTGHYDSAVDLIRQAIALRPNFPAAYNNLGNVLRDKGQLDEAIAAYRQAILLQPNYADAHCNLGNVLRDKGQFDQAIAAYRQAIAANPNSSPAHNNLGIALKNQGQFDAAIAAYRQAIALAPNNGAAYNNLGAALLGVGQLDQAIAALRRAMEIEPDNHELHSGLIFTLNFHPDYDAAAILRQARQFDMQYTRNLTQAAAPHVNPPDPQRRLRIGYVGPYFTLTSMGRFLLPLLAHHHHEAYEIVVYSSAPRSDAITDRLRSYADVWHDIAGLSDAHAADKIRADGIDLLVDLSLHSRPNRLLLFARKPAPVQVTWLGYVGTTGLSAMDYRISDPYLDPPGRGDEFYAEKTLRLPHCFWCYPPPDAAPEVNDLPAANTGHITFGCFNYFCKVTAPTLDLWAALLRQVKGSQIIIHAAAASHQQAIRRHFASAGVDGQRIGFVARQPMEDYFAQYGRIDVALDPFPYGGGTTTCDSLWMGVPVVTLAGATAVGRAGVSLLSNLGLPQLIARTPEQYLAKAGDLAAHWPRLAQLRRQLRPQMAASILMDGPRFAADMEAAYRQMWSDWCKTRQWVNL